MKVFGTPYPRERDVRQAFLDAISGDSPAEWNPFYKLDDPFYDSFGERGMRFYNAADEYALKISG